MSYSPCPQNRTDQNPLKPFSKKINIKKFLQLVGAAAVDIQYAYRPVSGFKSDTTFYLVSEADVRRFPQRLLAVVLGQESLLDLLIGGPHHGLKHLLSLL